MRGVFIIGFAILIDALQGFFALAFTVLQALTPVGGGIGAAGTCAAFSTGIVNKVVNGITCFVFGAGTSAFAVPIGAAVDVAITLTFGVALIAILAYSGMFYPGTIMGAFIGETIPLLDAIVPGWTLMAWRCVHNKHKEEAARSKAAQKAAVAQISTIRQQVWEDIRVGNHFGEPTNDYAEAAA